MERLVYVARHGETDWNALGKIQGHTDIPLNETGRDQARDLARQLRGKGIAAVASSDLARAMETARIVGEALGLGLELVERELRERHLGSFEGLTRDECKARFPKEFASWRAHPLDSTPPGAEPHPAFHVRVKKAVRKAAKLVAEGAVLVVTHGGCLKALLSESLRPNVIAAIPNAALYRFSVGKGIRLDR